MCDLPQDMATDQCRDKLKKHHEKHSTQFAQEYKTTRLLHLIYKKTAKSTCKIGHYLAVCTGKS